MSKSANEEIRKRADVRTFANDFRFLNETSEQAPTPAHYHIIKLAPLQKKTPPNGENGDVFKVTNQLSV